MDCIDILNKYDCCGCRACADVCPKKCINMQTDREGFFYPTVDHSQCVACGRCVSTCPIINHQNAKNLIDDDIAFAYISDDDEIIKSSSSGGAFTLIMDAVSSSENDYAIVGAAFDGLKVRHVAAQDRASADVLKKSKYIQSDTTGIYNKVKELLNKGTTVVFSGTPCQVAALKMFLRRDWANLLTVDIVCHGVPSQTHFDEYLNELEVKNQSKVVGVEFRHKKHFLECKPNPRTINVFFDNGSHINLDISESEFLYAYYTGLIFRPSCENCRYARGARPGDITLGDYWGIEKMYPEMNSLRGVSLVRFNSEKGKFLIDFFKEKGTFTETKWTFACAENHQLSFPFVPHRNRNKFFKLRSKGMKFCDNVLLCKRPDNIIQKVLRRLRNLICSKK